MTGIPYVARTSRRIIEGYVYVPEWAEHLEIAAV
jgi:hypothetical protein